MSSPLIVLPAKRTHGHSTERDVITKLREAYGWIVKQDLALDKDRMIDFVITGRHAQLSRVIGIGQMTFQGGNLHKTEMFLEQRRIYQNLDPVYLPEFLRSDKTLRPSMGFYFILDRDMRTDEVARQISDILEDRLVQDTLPALGEAAGFFLHQRSPWEPFNIKDRVDKLRRRADPIASAHLRKQGVITKTLPTGLVITYAAKRKEYFAYDSDVAEPFLHNYLLRFRHDPSAPSPIGLVVSFVPHETGKGFRKQALSLIYEATARAAKNQ